MGRNRNRRGAAAPEQTTASRAGAQPGEVAHLVRSARSLTQELLQDVTRLAETPGEKRNFFALALETLRAYEDYARAFCHLAELAEDRFHKTHLLRDIAAVLPEITAAPDIEGFWRSVCTLLTCEHGFRFDRALLFWNSNGSYPAECKMAVGGTGTHWTGQRAQIPEHYRTLHDYIADSVRQPAPGQGRCSLADPLFEAIRGRPLFFDQADEGRIRELCDRTRGLALGTAVKLTSSDPWIAKVQRERSDVFIAPHDEYFLFPLAPLGEQRRHELLGFALADMAYQPHPHVPGPNVPDLEMVALVLNLLSEMWLAREDSEAYLCLLPALPALRHSGWHLSPRRSTGSLAGAEPSPGGLGRLVGAFVISETLAFLCSTAAELRVYPFSRRSAAGQQPTGSPLSTACEEIAAAEVSQQAAS